LSDKLSLAHFRIDFSSGLEHATIRDNIIFGSKGGYDEVRYQAVIEACALLPDLGVLDAGDLTGEFLTLQRIYCSQYVPQKSVKKELHCQAVNELALL
jgi:hypothetical protein